MIHLTWSKLFGKLLIWFGCGNSKKRYYESLIINLQLISIWLPFFNFFITSIASPTEVRKYHNCKLIVQSVHGNRIKILALRKSLSCILIIFPVELIRADSIVSQICIKYCRQKTNCKEEICTRLATYHRLNSKFE